MWTVIVGDGLTKEFLSSDVEYSGNYVNVGKHEAERLLGRGRDFGHGPLPGFLRAAAKARCAGAKIGFVLIARHATVIESDITDNDPIDLDRFVEPFVDIAAEAQLVSATLLGVPWTEFSNAVEHITERNPLIAGTDRTSIRFLVVGCHTEHRILAIASFLRNVLGYPHVAVCAHLTGSRTPEAYYASLRHNFPMADIDVFVDLEDAAAFAGIGSEFLEGVSARSCTIDPPEVRDSLNDNQRSIIEFLCMHLTRIHVRPLQGGYSGSLLLLANGWKGQARTEPMVIKIDGFAQMRREIDGYHQVKDFFGKNVPTFDYPVAIGDLVGVAMEFAATEGNPETLQDTFEAAEDEDGFRHFSRRLDKALRLLSEKLYCNMQSIAWITPYRALGLHTDEQLHFLELNVKCIMGYCEAESNTRDYIRDTDRLKDLLEIVAANEDAVESEVCLAHGDLNYQNVVCDETDNIWFIDWTHCGYLPLELDFAKLENEIKFVMTKEFECDDLPRLKRLEEYLLTTRLPADLKNLPDSLNFAKWDLRFRKILEAVRKIREACFSVKEGEDWLVYRIALLKFALHTLSFDSRRGRGECDLPQLLHALFSVEELLYILIADDFHLKIRGERPASYPARQRISIDVSPWGIEYAEYAPPYYVDPAVLEQDRTVRDGGWADPEDVSQIPIPATDADVHRDDHGRPLNPRGRTGIAGRGLLGRWGPNTAVAAVITRENSSGDRVDILLGRRSGVTEYCLPQGFVLPEESTDSAIERILMRETGWAPAAFEGIAIQQGYVYDPRQTDHAWLDVSVMLLHCKFTDTVTNFLPDEDFEEVCWHPLVPDTVNGMTPDQARFVQKAAKRLKEIANINEQQVTELLSKTG